jgi:hypothetical protein
LTRKHQQHAFGRAPCALRLDRRPLGWNHPSRNTVSNENRAQRARWLKHDFNLSFPYVIDRDERHQPVDPVAVSDRPQVVVSRTSNLTPDGTFGQFIQTHSSTRGKSRPR